jgi:putative pyruvate formate lyase activating enzyme
LNEKIDKWVGMVYCSISLNLKWRNIKMLEELRQCEVCPFRCKVNRLEGKIGRCGCNDKIKIALASLHYYEEPCISGNNGSGTVFFSNCNLNCLFCQNYKISQEGKGREVSIEELADIFLNQQKNGANNINLVTPTMYAYQIIEALKIAKPKGLIIPVIYNTNGYENVETIKALKGYIDVYLPDLKYYSNEIAVKYSKAPNYFEIATKAILEMINQVGAPEFDENGLIKRGVIIRHLVLPGHIQNSKHILKWLKENVNSRAYVSVMAQYFPTYKAKEDKYLNRKLTNKEYSEIEQYLYLLDIENGYMQDLGKHEEEYVPDF